MSPRLTSHVEAGTSRQAGSWSVEDRLRELSAQGDPLEKLHEIVDFKTSRAVSMVALEPDERPKGGRLPFDAVLKGGGPNNLHGGISGLSA